VRYVRHLLTQTSDRQPFQHATSVNQVLPALRRALQDGSQAVRREAAAAVPGLGTAAKPFLESLRQALQEHGETLTCDQVLARLVLGPRVPESARLLASKDTAAGPALVQAKALDPSLPESAPRGMKAQTEVAPEQFF